MERLSESQITETALWKLTALLLARALYKRKVHTTQDLARMWSYLHTAP